LVARRFAPLRPGLWLGQFIMVMAPVRRRDESFTGPPGGSSIRRPAPPGLLRTPDQHRMSKTAPNPQLLHLVFGGELESLDGITFRDLHGLDIVGIYPNYAEAHAAWKAAAQKSVDNALMRYFVVHLHRLLDPATPGT
jgi:hypothetical protein